MDFTLRTYRTLITTLIDSVYAFLTFSEFLSATSEKGKCLVLRHDVDRLPFNSLQTAKIESKYGVHSTYYFRAVPESWNENIIKEIASLDHEIGYHCESLITCGGDVDAAYGDFCKNLEKLRQIVPVKTICMHGSPRSKYDSRILWNKYSYNDLGIIGEPYFDTDFSQILYLTDTGRMWDGYNVSIRDKIPVYQDIWIKKGLSFHSTYDIISAINRKELPGKIMLTIHPQRWTDNLLKWIEELLLQNVKNIVKKALVKATN